MKKMLQITMKILVLVLLSNFVLYSSIAKVSSTDKGTNVTLSKTFNNQTVWAGTFNGTVDGNASKFYCIDLRHYLAFNENYQDIKPTQTFITYILNNYYPYKPLPYTGALTEVKEAAAVQMAIWHFADELNIDSCGPTDIKTRAKEIMIDALIYGTQVVPVKTLLIYVPTQNLEKGTPANFWVEVYDELNRPVSGITVNLSVNQGTLSVAQVTTGTDGKSQQVTLTPTLNQMTATITAHSVVKIPHGTEYYHVANPDGKQKLVMATPVTANFNDNEQINWWENVNIVVNKTADKNEVNDGDIINYTLTVKNQGIVKATNVKVLDILPSELTYLGSAGDGTYTNTTGIWEVGDLEVNQTKSIVITARVVLANPTSLDLGVAKSFNLFVLGDMNSAGSDVQGKLAVKNDATLHSYAVGDKLPAHSGDVLIAGRRLTFKSGRVYNGSVAYGSFIDTTHCNLADDGIFKRSPIDFTNAENSLVNLSKHIATLDTNFSPKWYYNQYLLTGTNPKINIFKIDGTKLSICTNFEITAPAGATVIVNISGKKIEWHNGFKINGTTKDKILLNFYEADTISIAYIGIQGVFLAPQASLFFTSGLIDGQAIVKNMTGQGQFNLNLFTGNVTIDKKINNVAQLMSFAQFMLGLAPMSNFQVDKNGVTNIKGEESVPTQFNLNQNYPNPFNPSTTIKFELPEKSNVVINIYNALGAKVMELVNSDYQAGIHSISFNAANLSSGIYYYEMISNNFKAVKKMIYMK